MVLVSLARSYCSVRPERVSGLAMIEGKSQRPLETYRERVKYTSELPDMDAI